MAQGCSWDVTQQENLNEEQGTEASSVCRCRVPNGIVFVTPGRGQGHSHQSRMLQALASLALDTSLFQEKIVGGFC